MCVNSNNSTDTSGPELCPGGQSAFYFILTGEQGGSSTWVLTRGLTVTVYGTMMVHEFIIYDATAIL